jgi:hypothetical protein
VQLIPSLQWLAWVHSTQPILLMQYGLDPEQYEFSQVFSAVHTSVVHRLLSAQWLASRHSTHV